MMQKENTPTYVPRVDALETPEEVILRADLPGAGAGTVDIQYDKGVLSIHGKVRDREDE